MASAWPWVVRLVERLLGWPGRASDVEDVVQEVFLAAWRARDRFRGEAEWSTWLHRIAVNHARNAARARERRRRWFGLVVPREALDGAAHHAAPGPEESSDGLDVRRALRALAHIDREVLVLRYLDGLDIDAVAERIGVSRAAADQRLARARKRLRAAMDGEARR
jgi:RNA polymerase sigma-70 factor, ECF subfamily